ncbi:MAG: GlsB/YeaQ/YmgE family stress response membrane protein [Ktedonobacteraceae bacterium]
MTVATMVLADLTTMSLLWWLVVGLIAGVLAGFVMRGGFGIIGDIIAGIIGAFIGGWLFGVLGISAGGGLIGSIIVAFVGACILIFLLRLISRGSSSRRA